MEINGATTWLEIDLDAIRDNIRRMQEISGRAVMAVVKSNAYGHGVIGVARAAVSARAAWLGVARIEEALALRQANLGLPVLVLGYTLPDRVPEAIQQHIHLTLHDPALIDAYAAQARASGSPVRVHLKIDTGMGRLGVIPENALAFVRAAYSHPEIAVEGLFTHLARADEADLPTTMMQLKRFQAVLDELSGLGLRPDCIHAANSAAALNFPEARYDMVRVGIAMYGLEPSWPGCLLPAGFRPALAWKARLASVKTLPPGHGIGYGHSYVTQKEERIGVIPVGYGDGFRLGANNQVLVHGQRLPVIRRVCMDNSMLNLDSVPDARVGDEIVIIGSQGDQSIRAEDVALRWQTINYEVVCSLDARLPRLYLHNG